MTARVPIGQLLVEWAIFSQEQVDEILAIKRKEPGRFCSVALRRGLSDERTLVRALSRQLGVPGMLASEVPRTDEGVALFAREVSERLCVLPARVFHRTVTLVMRDPTDAAALSEFEFATGKIVRPLVGLEGPLTAAIRRFYDLAPAPAASLPPALQAEIIPETPASPLSGDTLPEQAGALETGFDELALLEADPRPRLLAIDDDANIQRVYEAMFAASPFRLFQCTDGALALEHIRRIRPVVVLLDGRLPGMHGFEICRRLKSDPTLAGTAVILLSGAYRGWQMRSDLMKHCGADDVLEKPFSFDYLNARVVELAKAAVESRPATGGMRPLEVDALRHLNAGLLHLQRGDLDAAAEDFRKSAEHQPNAARPHFYLGKIHERRDERYDAMFEYEQAVALDSTFFPAIKDLAILYQSNGFLQKAAETWQQALSSCPDASMKQVIREHLTRLL